MKVLQKILSHGLLIAFIVVAFLVYINRAQLLPKWFGKSETIQTSQVKESAPVQPVEPVATAPVITPGHTADLPATETAPVFVEPTASGARETVPVTESETSAPEPDAVARFRPQEPEEQGVEPGIESASEPEKMATSKFRPLQDEEADITVSEIPVEQASEPAPQAEPVQSAESVPSSAPADTEISAAEQSAVPETSNVAALDAAKDEADDKSLQQQLEEARQLYWQRDVEAATDAYQALGSDYPRNADVWGEIGNFYFSTEQQEPAGMAYYRTVSLLIDKGDTQKARELLGVLYKLDANRGRELDARLQ